MDIKDEIREVAAAIAASIAEHGAALFHGPLADEGCWQQDFRAALDIAWRLPRPFEVDRDGEDTKRREAERSIVASAARIADLMADERRARRTRPGIETQQ